MENDERLTLKGRKERRCGRARSHLRGWWRHADVANATGAQRTHLSLVFYSSLSLLLRFSFSFLSLSALLFLPFSAAVTWAARTRRALRLFPKCTPNSHQPNCSNGTESPLLSTFGAFLFETGKRPHKQRCLLLRSSSWPWRSPLWQSSRFAARSLLAPPITATLAATCLWCSPAATSISPVWVGRRSTTSTGCSALGGGPGMAAGRR